MADNIFDEVDEEVRREKLRQFWDRYGLYLIAAAALFVIAVGGWRGYEFWQNREAARSGSAFEAAIALGDAGKSEEAEKAFAQIAKDGSAGYRALARFRATAALAQHDPAAAVRDYDEMARSDISQTLRDLAALRAGFLEVDRATFPEVRKRLDPLAEPGRAFRHTARELLAFAAWKAGDVQSAKRYVDMLANDAETPQATRARSDMLAALLAADGGGDAGKADAGKSNDKSDGKS